ncbi:hypothetical protein ACF1A5_00220 [Streptomyces sp. NPDC014864]|uniref:hypothetical protein n=1 Tax=Streptomyces sp. NPDC014864 TaxID=3364924 RepID=UPI0036FB1018
MNALRSIKWPYALIALLAVAAATVGLLRPQLIPAGSTTAKKKPGATARIKLNPPPKLFTDAEIAAIGGQADAQRAKADAQRAKADASSRTGRPSTARPATTRRSPPGPRGRSPAPPAAVCPASRPLSGVAARRAAPGAGRIRRRASGRR